MNQIDSPVHMYDYPNVQSFEMQDNINHVYDAVINKSLNQSVTAGTNKKTTLSSTIPESNNFLPFNCNKVTAVFIVVTCLRLRGFIA